EKEAGNRGRIFWRSIYQSMDLPSKWPRIPQRQTPSGLRPSIQCSSLCNQRWKAGKNKVVMTKDKMPRLGASIQNLRDLSRSLWVIGVWAGEVPPSASVETKDGHPEYKVVNKVMADFSQKALDNPSANYVLIIDEINRATLPSVMGELIYALEYRYDEDNQDQTTVESMYSLKSDEEDVVGDRQLSLPSNLFIIGTMNTADRSVGHIDYA